MIAILGGQRPPQSPTSGGLLDFETLEIESGLKAGDRSRLQSSWQDSVGDMAVATPLRTFQLRPPPIVHRKLCPN
ncbi:MAG: hypothetical protein AAGE92_15310 [Cyanobacteria bacterium P01_G01_bin.4]